MINEIDELMEYADRVKRIELQLEELLNRLDDCLGHIKGMDKDEISALCERIMAQLSSCREIIPLTSELHSRLRGYIQIFSELSEGPPFVKPVQENTCKACESKDAEVDIRKVQFSAIAPKALVKGDYSLINVVMYEDEYRYAVEELLQQSAQEVKSGIHKVKTGSTIKIILTSPDIETEDNEEIQVWSGDYLNFSFAVMLPEDYEKGQVLFTAAVYVNDMIATRLKFVAKCHNSTRQKIAVVREDVLSAFVSYASQDRNRVAAIIQGMKKARPDMDIFFDVESLRSGENWEEQLWKEIESRDILFLCWSHYAKESKWVDAEWRYALSSKGADSIEPVPIEPPEICPPPDELIKKHFNDKLLYIINS